MQPNQGTETLPLRQQSLPVRDHAESDADDNRADQDITVGAFFLSTRSLKYGSPGGPANRAEILRVFSQAENRLREMASRWPSSMSGYDRYDLLQIANRILGILQREGTLPLSLDRGQRYKLRLKRLRLEKAMEQKAKRLARFHERWGVEALKEAPTVEPPPLKEICLWEIGLGWSEVARKMSDGRWTWALPPSHQHGFASEYRAHRIITTEKAGPGYSVLLARRVQPKVIPSCPDARQAEAAQLAAGLEGRP